MRIINRFLNSTIIAVLLSCTALTSFGSVGQDTFAIYSLGHGSLYFEYNDLIIHVDPYSAQADYTALPDADLILITHGHSDHYDLSAINNIKKASTLMVYPQAVKNLGSYTDTAYVMNNGDSMIFNSLTIKAVPAYNIVSSPIYHPVGNGNGYVLTFGEKRIYIAGDTEDIPEMDNMGKIDIAFIPMNLPYTMTVTMAVEAAKSIKPDILYIYHFGNSDTASLRSLLKDQNMEVRIGTSVYFESDIRTQTSSIQDAKNYLVSEFYPNPASEFLWFNNQNTESTLFIFNLSGSIMIKQDFQDIGDQYVDIRSLMSGIYLMNVACNETVKSCLLYKE